MAYELFYWPGLQGRGEFARLALEDAGAEYVDVVRKDGVSAMTALMKSGTQPQFAPPFLRDGDLIVGQTAAILLHLGGRLGLAPEDEAGKLWTHQIQLTVSDLTQEAHDTHHPVGNSLYYDDQKPESARKSKNFRDERIPKYLGWFESVLSANSASDATLVGATHSYADLSLFQVIAGLRYAFPKATARALKQVPGVVAVHDRVAQRPRLRAYLDSDRRIAFNQDGIFRHYPELDG